MYYETTDYNIKHNLETTSIGIVGLGDQRMERELPATLRTCISIPDEYNRALEVKALLLAQS